jgi:hypothetical protein
MGNATLEGAIAYLEINISALISNGEYEEAEELEPVLKWLKLNQSSIPATTAAHGVPDDILNWIQQDPSDRWIDSSTTWNVGYRTAWATIGIMFEKHGLLNAAPSARQEPE